jgi:hypothetical protein
MTSNDENEPPPIFGREDRNPQDFERSVCSPSKEDFQVMQDWINETISDKLWWNKDKEEEEDYALVHTEISLEPAVHFNEDAKESAEIWVADTGSSCNATNNNEGLYEVQEVKGGIKVGDGRGINITHKGKLDVTVCHADGTEVETTLAEVMYAPEMRHHLFGISTAMMKGWTLTGKNQEGKLSLELSKKGFATVKFDQMIKSGSSYLLGAKLKRRIQDVNMAQQKGTKMTRRILHGRLGHCGAHLVDSTAQSLDIELTGTLSKCENCTLEKIRQKNVSKESHNKATEPGERIYLDISSMKHSSLGGNKHWLLIVDEATRYKKSFFMKKKSALVEDIMKWFLHLKGKFKIKVKNIRLDNSGENKSL